MKILLIVVLVFTPVVKVARADETAQTPPAGNWAMVEVLSQDSPVTVRIKAGDKIHGEFLALEAESIQLRVDGQERSYRRADVAEISQSRPHNRKKNMIWGALIGFGLGFPSGYFIAPYAAQYDRMPNSEQAAWGAGFGAIGAGIGAGLAALAGSSHEVVIYRTR